MRGLPFLRLALLTYWKRRHSLARSHREQCRRVLLPHAEVYLGFFFFFFPPEAVDPQVNTGRSNRRHSGRGEADKSLIQLYKHHRPPDEALMWGEIA